MPRFGCWLVTTPGVTKSVLLDVLVSKKVMSHATREVKLLWQGA